MPRKFHNDDFVRIRYYSRNSTVLGVGTVVDYISSKRKYLVRVLGVDMYATNYWRCTNLPHDKIINCHAYELAFVNDNWYLEVLSEYATQMRKHISGIQQDMHRYVSDVMTSKPRVRRVYIPRENRYEQVLETVASYFGDSYEKGVYDYNEGKGRFLSKHAVYLSFCIARLNQARDDASCLYRAYPETKTFERSEYVWN